MALLLTAELLRFSPETLRARLMLDALAREAKAAGITIASNSTEYRGGADLLVLWGPGSPLRFEPMRQQLAAGGHVAAFDVSYWHQDQKTRVSIDAAHPHAWVMRRTWPRQRFTIDRPRVADVWNPKGPVIVAGLGTKAKIQYGSAVDHWEADMIAQARARGWAVRYRPKKLGPVPATLPHAGSGPIETVLRGASLVMTWHSNVAVDAIRLGIPVVCRDGAAAAVCPATIPDDPRPLPPATRDTFLGNLAWFQWGTTRDEVRGCWQFLREILA